MTERTAPALDPARGDRLDHAGYRRDFWQCYAGISGRSSWKFERRQHFEEPDDPSWEAFQQGRWEEALRLLDAEREELEQAVKEDAAHARPFHRVRIVEEPLVPYMQWELHALRIQAECGELIHVVPGEAVRRLEEGGVALPEVVVLGGEVLYQVCYTEAGVPDGGIRFTDTGVVERWERFIAGLYEQGEEMLAYAQRVLVHLSPPQPQAR